MSTKYLRKCNKVQDQRDRCHYFMWQFIKEDEQGNGRTMRRCTNKNACRRPRAEERSEYVENNSN
jgi:hypothetical protein